MLTKIMFRTCTLMLLINLIACVPEDSVVPKYEAQAQFLTDDSQPPVSAIPLPPVSIFLVEIQASNCIIDGVNLIATNPNLPGNPAYTDSKYLVHWYRNGQIIGTGAQLFGCICGGEIQVKVTNTDTGGKGAATYTAKPCKAQIAVDKF